MPTRASAPLQWGGAFALLVFALAFVGAGCGSSGHANGPGTIAQGRVLFQLGPPGKDGCGFCHTLASARTSGPFAPNLDGEVTEWRTALKYSEQKIRAVVVDQIGDPTCENPQDPGRCMPKDLFTGRQAKLVAAFVARCGGRSGKPGCEPVAGGFQGAARRGEYLFTHRGCAGCHWADSGKPVGPSFHGLAGSDVELANGQTVKATDAYLITSILAPDAQIVKGYPRGFMSSRISAEHISAAEAKALVAYIKTQE